MGDRAVPVPLRGPRTGPRAESAALSPGQYLASRRAALRGRRHRATLDDLRESCETWTIGEGPDPIEPLVNAGRRAIDWPALEWNGLVFEPSCRLRWSLDGTDRVVSFDRMTPELAGYIAFVFLELCARESPARDEEQVIGHALLAAARHRAEPAGFRRYLIGWHDGPGEEPWNGDARRLAALAVALGSAEDPLVGPRVRGCREWLDRGATAMETRFRDIVPGDERAAWHEVAEASASDARAWAAAYGVTA